MTTRWPSTAPGAGHVAAAAKAAGAWTIHVSTDYVFDGDKREPYVESDAGRATLGLRALQARGRAGGGGQRAERHTIVRSSWLFGAGGRCFPQTMLELAGERDRLTVVDDQVGCPTFTGHLAAALVELAARGRGAARSRCTSPGPASARGLSSRRRSLPGAGL